MLLVSVRKKHLIFWLILLIVSVGLWVGYNKILAEVVPLSPAGGVWSQQLTITSQARADLGDKDISFALEPGISEDQTDGFFYKFLDNSGVSFSRLELTIILPDDLQADLVKVQPVLAYTDLPEVIVKKEGNQITVTGYQLGPQALFSLNMSIPRGYLSFPWYKTAWQFVKNQRVSFWLGISILLPLTALISFLVITNQQRRLKKQLKTEKQISRPPSQLSPAVVDIIFHNRVTPRAIASSLVDMANRGLIEIVFKDDRFSFSRLGLKAKQAGEGANLEPAEKVILSKLFRGEKFLAEEGEIRFRVAHRLFSNKIALFYYLLYHQAFEKGLFIQEPAGVHRHYRNWGLVIFFSGVAGLIISLLFIPASMALPWLGMVLAGVLFLRLSSRISFLSTAGLKELSRWMAFRNYLTSSQPLGGHLAEKKLLFDYLPYAIALDCEREWLVRFRDKTFSPPAWYVTFGSTVTRQSFGDSLLSLLRWLSESLTYAKDPSVE
jgi:hypothetical protein